METIFRGTEAVRSPCPFPGQDAGFLVVSESGDVARIGGGGTDDESFHVIAQTRGCPMGVARDATGTMYVCDCAHKALLVVDPSSREMVEFVREFEGKPLKGPHSVIVDQEGSVYFTDSGPLGETTLQTPCGSVFCVDGRRKMLHALLFEGLAYPSGLALSQDGRLLYVAETMRNRIIRFVQRPAGVFHASVFLQLAGGMGPMALAIHPDTGNLYVGCFDISDDPPPQPGRVLVVTNAGQVVETLPIQGCEVTGLAFRGSKGHRSLVVTEASSRVVFQKDDV